MSVVGGGGVVEKKGGTTTRKPSLLLLLFQLFDCERKKGFPPNRRNWRGLGDARWSSLRLGEEKK